MKRKHLHCTPMDLVISADAQNFMAGQNDAELSLEIYQYSISFFYFCGVFRQRNFLRQNQDQPLFQIISSKTDVNLRWKVYLLPPMVEADC